MSRFHNACNLCGWTTCAPEGTVSWLNQYRGLLSRPTGEIVLSGVGLYDGTDDGDYFAPPDPKTRWDDPGYEQSDSDMLFGYGRRTENGQYGFLFHESCWSVLERAFYPAAVPYARLYEVCLSLPRPRRSTCVSWGHDYGGVVAIDDTHYFPWDDRETVLHPVDGATREIPEIDPYNVPEIQLLLQDEAQSPPNMRLSEFRDPQGDCLFKLPVEIRTAISLYLSTTDALNARQASKSFWHIFHSHQFWVSRFRSNAERSWVFEAQTNDGARDWRWLYRQTNDMNISVSFAIKNRRRVWNLSLRLFDILDLRNDQAISTVPENFDMEDVEWTEASGRLHTMHPDGPQVDFYEGCHVFHTLRQDLRNLGALSQVAFSFVRVGDTNYLAGIRLILISGESVQIGYRASYEQFFDLPVLQGFNLALGPRGIHAIQCLTDCRALPWCGDPGDLPRSRRVATPGPIAGIEVGLDGCKIGRLSVAVRHSQRPREMTSEQAISLRDLGIWHPDVPGPQLFLNEDSFPQRIYHVVGYRPLIWTSFGGPGGIYLRNLVGLAVHASGGTCYGIDFWYNNRDIPKECRTLGRHKCHKVSPRCRTQVFTIDGPGGEVINGIEIYLTYIDDEILYEIYHQGALESFKVFTNHGRSFHFKDEDMTGVNKWRMEIKKVNIAAGSIITGFYARQFQGPLFHGLSALGVISEAVKEQEGRQVCDRRKARFAVIPKIRQRAMTMAVKVVPS